MQQLQEPMLQDPKDLHGEAGDLFSVAWTRTLRAMSDVSALPAPGTPAHTCLTAIAGRLGGSPLVPRPLLRRPPWATAALREALLAECVAALPSAKASTFSTKKNADTGEDVHDALSDVDVAGYVAEQTGLDVTGPVASTYVIYDTPGAALQLHLDMHNFGHLNLLLCLDRTDVRAPEEASATVFVTGDGIDRYHFGPGECLVFDARYVPHGRTPLCEGERVLLLSVGFDLVGA